MIKVGQVVKLKNPKNKREAKRRWRVRGFITRKPTMTATDYLPNSDDGVRTDGGGGYTGVLSLRRLDTVTRRLEHLEEVDLVPISFWERLFKRY